MAPDFSLPRVAMDEDRRPLHIDGSDSEESEEEEQEQRSVSLSDFRGKKVMLCFDRCAACPLCNMAVDDLKGHYKKLAWASKLEVIKVFPSPQNSTGWNLLKSGAVAMGGYDEDGKVPLAAMEGKYPFVILSDDADDTYNTYGVQSTLLGLLGGIPLIPSNTKRRMEFCKSRGMSSVDLATAILKAHKEGNNNNRLPAEFLIDEEGRIVDCFRAKNINEHIPIERVSQFLMDKAAG